MTKELRGKPVAKALLQQTEKTIEDLKKIDCYPTLAIVRVGDDESSVSYENAAIKTMQRAGIAVEPVIFKEETSSEEILQALDSLNKNTDIHGVLVMQPLPGTLSRNDVARCLDSNKDIDGLTPENLGRLVENDPIALFPSTPKAVMALLDFYDIEVEGKDVCVIGSSPVVGKPLTIMLLNREASVANVHIKTKDVKQYTRQADIVISATGAVELVTADYIKEGAVVVDVGFGYKDGKPVGDVKYDEVFAKASAVTPVPGGVGSITTAILAEQVAQAAWNQRSN
ncbi:bifunctional 5,10-methylenetetrahydrofolate dehydrogenase/5,10-methenyltetrahydrofolate cyclohydrolase [Alkalibacterium olivapovliticus]|uniref:Bifunctional protein FolD n=1 Tax=Alkalibacterium olivapovliticus TaxID=99907 RepID=A0A2T0W5C9_9LACT|nr:bifunctional 5,10-methylenetetrahydrofolate dehydrogenase/5,10-methenyltetrahydrofolate cyclohydrolase [Alkalibacterium olivapovliticus]MCC5895358.1 bifunctional 5,10-methylenetetrahydrofolate dehydrogenase/5,10-methenyltetrahydrofolate cyclohydrolase [Alkalibacterium sp.]PRY80967.1 methylenetetrahydrofolate dehydrogenase (NADP+)/methenyltetrahydrofolate cyclohydrolase [Alkalibacterium olivapovliticus]